MDLAGENVSDDAVEGKIGKIYIPDQKVSGKFIHLAVIASTIRYLTSSEVKCETVRDCVV